MGMSQTLTETKAAATGHILHLEAVAVPLSRLCHQIWDPHGHCVRVFNKVHLYPATFGQGFVWESSAWTPGWTAFGWPGASINSPPW